MAFAGHNHMKCVTNGLYETTIRRPRSEASLCQWRDGSRGGAVFVTVTYFNSLLADETVTDEFGLTCLASFKARQSGERRLEGV
jgi:hypothetical protein